MATVDAAQSISGLSEWGVVLEGVSWETYEKLIKGIGDRYVFVNYDRGVMEIQMSPGRKHEFGEDLLRSFVTMLRFLKNIPMEGGGSTTHQREDLEKGVEPDACFWIAHEKEMRGVMDLDLTKHPAPDLVIEVDVTSTSVDRIEIFRQLGVPEIWRSHRGGLDFLILGDDGQYHCADKSLSFPFVDREPVERAITTNQSLGETAALNKLLEELKLR